MLLFAILGLFLPSLDFLESFGVYIDKNQMHTSAFMFEKGVKI